MTWNAGKRPAVGLKDVVSRGDLARLVDGHVRRLHATEFDSELLQVVDAAVVRNVPTALVLPITGTNTSLLW
jgi:hypothetical protein